MSGFVKFVYITYESLINHDYRELLNWYETFLLKCFIRELTKREANHA